MAWLYSLVSGEALWRIASYAKKQAVLVAVILALAQVAVLIWAAFGLIIGGLIALLPVHPLTDFGLQFLPSRWYVDTGITFFITSLITKKVWHLWSANMKIGMAIGSNISTRF